MCSIRDEVHITKGNCIMTDTIINVSSLSFGYAGSDVLVLEDITFDIKKGEIALIIGASGSGKTTLLKMLDKSMIPEGRLSGKAEYYGRQISSLSQAEAAVKMDMSDRILTTRLLLIRYGMSWHLGLKISACLMQI